ncbi:hypothetical protein [Bifidobacterium eulemuris]|uniref:Lipoprotein n=1 Tax=Bifidobacterium eulemuris TaxID=1765219 RepID=A0A261GD48_9BIFI|nr:hypothetical protein [Bifidobacterium eulemuris]OZG68896.1 hypothetical protein BEUL_0302 [Bifidobacterium eulemuris]QOL31565.1 hypothetical protein BE0216_03125 [Bifidobacterium eulemuris]
MKGMIRFGAAAVAVMTLAGMSGCSQAADGGQTTADDVAGESRGKTSGGGASQNSGRDIGSGATGEKLANSLDEYIDMFISNQFEPASDYEKTVMERAKADGGVTAADYEDAWSTYKSCMLDKGYKEIVLIKYPNGIYEEAVHYSGTDSQEEKYDADQASCFGNVNIVAEIYAVQQGNGSLLSNRDEAIVDCLRRNDLVPKDYTAEQYARERADGELSYDAQDMGVRGCQAANNSFVGFADDPVEKLW